MGCFGYASQTLSEVESAASATSRCMSYQIIKHTSSTSDAHCIASAGNVVDSSSDPAREPSPAFAATAAPPTDPGCSPCILNSSSTKTTTPRETRTLQPTISPISPTTKTPLLRRTSKRTRAFSTTHPPLPAHDATRRKHDALVPHQPRSPHLNHTRRPPQSGNRSLAL